MSLKITSRIFGALLVSTAFLLPQAFASSKKSPHLKNKSHRIYMLYEQDGKRSKVIRSGRIPSQKELRLKAQQKKRKKLRRKRK